MSININNTNDLNYRYKMNKLITRQTGRGGNCHTVLENLETICNQLNTMPEIILSYIGNVLGCQIVQSTSSLKGHYTTEKIQEIIFNFINFATLCQKCNIPELTPDVSKNNKDYKLNMKCSACGYMYELLGNNKNNNKLVDTIIKYYSTNLFKPSKGNMVVNKTNEDFNPF